MKYASWNLAPETLKPAKKLRLKLVQTSKLFQKNPDSPLLISGSEMEKKFNDSGSNLGLSATEKPNYDSPDYKNVSNWRKWRKIVKSLYYALSTAAGNLSHKSFSHLPCLFWSKKSETQKIPKIHSFLSYPFFWRHQTLLGILWMDNQWKD